MPLTRSDVLRYATPYGIFRKLYAHQNQPVVTYFPQIAEGLSR